VLYIPKLRHRRRTLGLFALTVFAAIALAAFAAAATPAPINDQPGTPRRPGDRISTQERLLLIRGLQSEVVYVRRLLPIAKTGAIIKNGQVTPSERDILKIAADKGIAAKPGDKAVITALNIEDDKIVLEINGGPKKKGHWYDHVQLGVGGGGGGPGVGPAPDPQQQKQQAADPSTAGNLARGCLVTLAFDGLVPSLTVDEVKNLLTPVFSFNAKSAAEALMDRMPPVVQQALKDHKVLVGMDRDLVNAAKGRPQQRIREKDETGHDYEEWIYGAQPEEVQFVRFVGDEVVQVKTMTVDGQKIVRTKKELDMKEVMAGMGRPTSPSVSGTLSGVMPPPDPNADKNNDDPNAPKRPRPTLHKPGEAPDPDLPPGAQQPTPTSPSQPKAPDPH
jgi:hypothetical protein